MSWSASVTSFPSDDLDNGLQGVFEKHYPEPTEGVAEQFHQALEALSTLKEILPETELCSASLSGHVKNNDASSYINVNVTAHD